MDDLETLRNCAGGTVAKLASRFTTSPGDRRCALTDARAVKIIAASLLAAAEAAIAEFAEPAPGALSGASSANVTRAAPRCSARRCRPPARLVITR